MEDKKALLKEVRVLIQSARADIDSYTITLELSKAILKGLEDLEGDLVCTIAMEDARATLEE